METDVEGLIGEGKRERADQRTTWRSVCAKKSAEKPPEAKISLRLEGSKVKVNVSDRWRPRTAVAEGYLELLIFLNASGL